MVIIMNLLTDLFELYDTKNIGLAGFTDESFCIYINELYYKENKNIVIVTPTLFEANKLFDSLNNYNNNVYLFPMDEFLTTMAISSSPELMINRLETLNALNGSSKKIVITHLMGYLKYLPSKKLYNNSFIELKINQDYDIKELIKNLINIGYNRETIVAKTGDIAIRGYILDIFSIGENHPIRIEFFGDTIESIRYFDEDTQKSINEVEKINIPPANEFLLEKYELDEYNKKHYDLYNNKLCSIKDYLDNCITIIKDYKRIKNLYKETKKQIKEYIIEKDKDYKGNYMHSIDIIDENECMYYMHDDNLIEGLNLKETYDLKIKTPPSFRENIDAINTYLKKSFNKTVILCLKDYQIRNFVKYLDIPYILSDINKIYLNKVNIVNKELNEGFIYNNYIILTNYELFNVKNNNKKFKTKFKFSTKVKNVDNLSVGDYVVHTFHGIGVYNGIKTLSSYDIKKDYLEILYKGTDKLYIPVEKIDTISKYSGKEGISPKINTLGSQEWQKTKARVREKVKNIANELIKIYAERKMQAGFKFSKDDELQEIFEKEFAYIPTSDQNVAIKEIKDDMESIRPMDRLLCGDVGFGKTEVAFRAMFKAVMNGKQVLYLCPTTILSMQQYNNAKERFKNFPISIGLLNRFVSSKNAKEIVENLRTGKVDIVIGTHRLLSDDIKPNDLGLLIIDEEQRFGVSHKERIKKYKANVDVLTLTATPIPRTLQMSLIGIRGLSLIKTPPINRYPVQTYVLEESKQIIKDAIYKELNRNGQVFILYNHIDDIEHKSYEINSLVPEAKIIFAHGRMDKYEIEDKMIDFINHKVDILICTTIIETGIDIPNANTLIILEADHFGLAQLYQLRGRVGRSDRIAYAYMMYKPGKLLGEIAVKRLNVIKEFTELGSGYNIASRDLSIRGAGDILGSEQAGFIDTVGINLYLKILNEEIARIKGDETIEQEPISDKSLLNITTHIENEYVDDNSLKIEIHKLINTIDSYDKLKEVKIELEDRFGKINNDIKIYMYEEWFEKLAHDIKVIQVIDSKTEVKILFDDEISKQIDGEKIFMDSYKISKDFKFKKQVDKFIVILSKSRLDKHYIYYLIDLLLLMKSMINDCKENNNN